MSVTSYPARVHKLYQTIESIFQQNVQPDIIHVWLAKKEFSKPSIPNSLLRLQKRGVRIDFVDENLRPYNKLYYAWQQYPKAKIITIDDDIIYPRNWLEGLMKANQTHPNDIICYRGHDLRLRDTVTLMPYKEMKRKNNLSTESSFELMPTGVSGVLYPPGSLHEEVLNKSLFMEIVPTGDDIWFKCCALLNNTKSRRVLPHNIHFRMVKDSQSTSLYYTNVILNKNDDQLKNSFDHFNLYPFIALR